ncbi:MAG: hypothetical protein K0S76_1379 [Herbinix sp.]|jgi:hypothetical protein|nr:hypothetical protein [Herbinix sp.]
MLPGVFPAVKKNGEAYYRASITYKSKHISLGSFSLEKDANLAYLLAGEVLTPGSPFTIDSYPNQCVLPLHKWVVLINFRDNGIYFKNPIYIKKRYFIYHIDRNTALKFDAEDLFYYAHRKILKRGGHLFVSDYGMQINVLSRYGIKNYAVPGRDYRFINGDDTDYRYHNIEIINRFHGVTKSFHRNNPVFTAKIHINGDFLVGHYKTEQEAAIAYNKAVLILQNAGFKKNYPQNYIDDFDEISYASIFQRLRISKKLLAYAESIGE